MPSEYSYVVRGQAWDFFSSSSAFPAETGTRAMATSTVLSEGEGAAADDRKSLPYIVNWDILTHSRP